MDINPNKIIMHPFAAAILYKLKDEEVEIYCGDSSTTRIFSDTERAQKNLLRGVIRDAMGDCLIIECKKHGENGTVFLNVWGIKAIMKMRDSLFISDVFEDEEDFLNEKRKNVQR